MHVLIVLVMVAFAFVTVGASFPKVTPYPSENPTEVKVKLSAQNAGSVGGNTLQLRTFAAEKDPILPTPACPVSGNADVMLVIDYSGSTKGETIDKEKIAAKLFIDTMARNPQNRVGVVTFSDQAQLVSELTSDFTTLKQKIDNLPKGKGYTCMKCGIETGNNEIALKGRAGIQKAMVLLSDGRTNVPKPVPEAEKAAINVVNFGFNQYKTILYTVGFSSPPDNGRVIIGTNDVNEGFMRQIATITGGKYYFSPTQDDLSAVFRDLGLYLVCHLGQGA
jgi:hypothetical protein